VELSPSIVLGATRDVDQKTLTIVIPVSEVSASRVLPTVISGLFQDYQSKRVVLLLDDSTVETTRGSEETESKELPSFLNRAFSDARSLINRSYSKFTLNQSSVKEERHRLGVLCQHLSFVFARFQMSLANGTPESEFAAQNVLGTYQKVFVESATRIICGQAELEREELERFYGDLLRLFSVKLVTFDSGQFREQSSMRGKASSLNMFLACMGRGFKRGQLNGQIELRDCNRNETAEILVPDSDYVMVVEEGTVLLPEYASTLVKIMESPGFKRVAVAQAELIEKLEDDSPHFRTLIASKFLKGASSFWLGDCAIFRKEALGDVLRGGQCGPVDRSRNLAKAESGREGFDQVEFKGRNHLTLAFPKGGWGLLSLSHGLYFRGPSLTPDDVMLRRSRRAVCGRICSPFEQGAKNLRSHLLLDSSLRVYYLITTLLLTALGAGAYLQGGSFTTSLWLCSVLIPYHLQFTREMKRRGYRGFQLLRITGSELLYSFWWSISKVRLGVVKVLRFVLDGPVLVALLWGAGISVCVSLVIMYWQSPHYFAAFWQGVSILAIFSALAAASYYLCLLLVRRAYR
jgi:hypothetical protein